jgi:hypothetical protein
MDLVQLDNKIIRCAMLQPCITLVTLLLPNNYVLSLTKDLPTLRSGKNTYTKK